MSTATKISAKHHRNVNSFCISARQKLHHCCSWAGLKHSQSCQSAATQLHLQPTHKLDFVRKWNLSKTELCLLCFDNRPSAGTLRILNDGIAGQSWEATTELPLAWARKGKWLSARSQLYREMGYWGKQGKATEIAKKLNRNPRPQKAEIKLKQLGFC